MARFKRIKETKNFVVFQSDGSDGVAEFTKLYLAKDDPKAMYEELVLEWAGPGE